MPPHASADNWIKALPSKDLPTRAKPRFPTASPSNPEAHTSLLASFFRGQREEARRTTVSQLEQKPHYRKLIGMKKQKVMTQMKGQGKTSEKQLNEAERGNLPEKEFRTMIVKMIQDLGKTMEKMQEMFTKDLEKLKNKQRYTRRNQ